MSLTGSANSKGALHGSADSGFVLHGKLSGLNTIHGYSAYEVAVICGFRGTEEEWLASLKGASGATPVKGVDYYTNAEKQAFIEEILAAATEISSPARIGEVLLLASAWNGSGVLHSQIVAIDGVTENSQVDLTPNVEQLVVFHEKDLTFVTENDGGVVTVYAIGQKPTNDYTIQVTITEVSV